MVHILMTNAQHCNKQWKLWGGGGGGGGGKQTGKRKENNNTFFFKVRLHKERKTKIQQNRKVTKTDKALKGAAKTREQTRS